MNTSMSWIKMYVPDLDVTAQEYTDAMTLSGTKVEGFEKLDADLDKIVIGQIEKIEKHPDADKLIICQVNIGTETVQIVTGAPNVKEGDKVPVVLDGGRVAGGHDGQKTPGGIKIKKGKLRGVESFGMMCSIEELGSTREMYPEAPEYGIYIFPEDAVVGESAIKALGLDDVVIEYEITSNRVDCYGVLGIAREAAATFDKKLLGNTLSPHQSTDILSLDSSPGVPQSTLLETAFSTPSTKQAKLLFVPVYAYLSVSRSHPVLPHNKHLSNGCYDYGSVPRPFLTHVPGESPHHE